MEGVALLNGGFRLVVLNTPSWGRKTTWGRTSVPFLPSVRRLRCSQAGRDVLRRSSTVLRYAARVIRTTCAQKSARFPGRARDVLAPLQVTARTGMTYRQCSGACSWRTTTVAGHSARRRRVAFRLSLSGVRGGRHPAHEDLIAQRQQGGADEHSQDSSGCHATKRPE